MWAADNVFVIIKVAVQYQINDDEESVKAAQYGLTNAQQQIESYIFGELPQATVLPFCLALAAASVAAAATAVVTATGSTLV